MRICGASHINSCPKVARSSKITQSRPDFLKSQLLKHPILSQISKPVSILNNSSSHLSCTAEIKYVQWHSECFDLLDAGNGLYIPVAEVVFIQIAQHLSPVQAACLGSEICGLYELGAQGNTTPINKLVPFASTQKIETALSQLEGKRGILNVRKSLPFICERSASHMETATFLRLTLPYRSGGFNLPRPQMNYQIRLDKRRRSDGDSLHYFCDLFWPEHGLAVEYDSDFHASSFKIGKDAYRKNALLDHGIDVITITKRQMFNMDEFNQTARVIARKLGVRHQPRCSDYRKRQVDLVKELFPSRLSD